MKITARIRNATGKGLWLFVDREGEIKTAVEDLESFTSLEREEDKAGQVAYAILPEEVKAIRDACDEYLKSNKN